MVRFYLFSLGLILGKLVPVSQVSSNIETLNHSTLHSVWKEAPQAGRQQKISKWSLKLIRFTRLLPCQRAIKAERLLRWKEVELQRPDQLPRSRKKKKRGAWKRVRPTEASRKCTLQPAELPAGCAVSSRFPAFVSCHPCWGGLWRCSCLWVVSAPVSDPSPTSL